MTWVFIQPFLLQYYCYVTCRSVSRVFVHNITMYVCTCSLIKKKLCSQFWYIPPRHHNNIKIPPLDIGLFMSLCLLSLFIKKINNYILLIFINIHCTLNYFSLCINCMVVGFTRVLITIKGYASLNTHLRQGATNTYKSFR